MSFRTTRDRQRRWRLIFILLMLGFLFVGLLSWRNQWRTPQEIIGGMYNELQQQAPAALTGAIPGLQPTARWSDRVALVDSELLPNPQSHAFTADLYIRTNLEGVVPWPNAGGRTEPLTHTVQSGDSLYGLAFVYSLDLNTILWANPFLNPDNPLLQIADELRILPVQGTYHVVVEGETVETIAAQYGVLPPNISNYPPNNLHPPFKLTAGQPLIVPYGRPLVNGEIPPLFVDTPFVWPLVGLISKGFHPDYHPGLQINAPAGSSVQVVANGEVLAINPSEAGAIVMVEHGGGLESWYGNVQEVPFVVGDSVSTGQVIGQVSQNRGNERGSSLYFAVYEDGQAVDPLDYLPGGSEE